MTRGEGSRAKVSFFDFGTRAENRVDVEILVALLLEVNKMSQVRTNEFRVGDEFQCAYKRRKRLGFEDNLILRTHSTVFLLHVVGIFNVNAIGNMAGRNMLSRVFVGVGR